MKGRAKSLSGDSFVANSNHQNRINWMISHLDEELVIAVSLCENSQVGVMAAGIMKWQFVGEMDRSLNSVIRPTVRGLHPLAVAIFISNQVIFMFISVFCESVCVLVTVPDASGIAILCDVWYINDDQGDISHSRLNRSDSSDVG